ncbi:MAG: hypothetical protein AB3N20_15230 [Rhizobiaceae bacterium]
MNMISAIGLFIAGLIHIAPVTGVLGAETLTRLYGMRFESPEVVLLLRHRAVLFGMLGLLLLAAAFVPGLRAIAVLAAAVSILSFLVLAGLPGNRPEAIARIIYADWLALVAMLPTVYLIFHAGVFDSG